MLILDDKNKKSKKKAEGMQTPLFDSSFIHAVILCLKSQLVGWTLVMNKVSLILQCRDGHSELVGHQIWLNNEDYYPWGSCSQVHSCWDKKQDYSEQGWKHLDAGMAAA